MSKGGAMRSMIIAVAVALGASVVATAAGAPGGGAPQCRPITAIPFTIGEPGSYCLIRDLSTPLLQGAALRITADGVAVDLAGFSMASTARDSVATAIEGRARRGITIRNGRILGFAEGVDLSGGDGSAGHAVEDLQIADARRFGIRVSARDSVVRRNRVALAAVAWDETDAAGEAIVGIWVEGERSRVEDNDVVGAGVRGMPRRAVLGILVRTSPGALVSRNRITAERGDGLCGIRVQSSEGVDIVANRLAGFDSGIAYEDASGAYSSNVTSGRGTPFLGGTDLGDNH
jgi:nitrous oxidase accessory protein NosD